MWWWLLIFAVCIIVYVFLENFINFKLALKYKKLYVQFLNKEIESFSQYKNLATGVIAKAGVQDAYHVVKDSSRYINTVSKVSLFDSCVSRSDDSKFSVGFLEKLDNAIGVFRHNFVCSLIPFYWIKFLIFIPQYALDYFNIRQETIIKIAQAIYWLATLTLVILQIVGVISVLPQSK